MKYLLITKNKIIRLDLLMDTNFYTANKVMYSEFQPLSARHALHSLWTGSCSAPPVSRIAGFLAFNYARCEWRVEPQGATSESTSRVCLFRIWANVSQWETSVCNVDSRTAKKRSNVLDLLLI